MPPPGTAYDAARENRSGDQPVYPFVYWAGVATTLVWVAFTAYSALNGF
jgi:hypothetical protein